MDWIYVTQKAINFIEDNLTDDISNEAVAKYLYSSNHHFQRIFGIVTGFTISDYIRNRRLSLAGQELFTLKSKVIDVALKYRYDSPESFTKAFIRFHGITPSAARESNDNLKCFSPLTIQINVKGGFIMTRKLIPNIVKLCDVQSENYMFDSCMRTVMKAFNENESMNFTFFAGITGDLFTQTWGKPNWQYNNEYSLSCRNTLVPIRSAFEACGYEFEYIHKDDIQRNKPEYVRRIVESIDRGYPVLTFGIVGPPTCSIIFGYDENGDLLIGWSQFTDEVKEDNPMDLELSDNYFQKRNGLDRSEGIIFILKKNSTPAISEHIKKSILNIPKLASLQSTNKISLGRQAFDDWADSLLCDDDFADESMLARPLDTYGSCMVMLGTNMYNVQDYLNMAKEECPDIKPQIEMLQLLFIKEKEALDKIVELQGGYFFDSDRRALLNKDFRIKLSELIKKTGQCYADAVYSMGKY
ncbi:MAG: helix-turn-helix domain-containing protein [Eubacteriales bacterium]